MALARGRRDRRAVDTPEALEDVKKIIGVKLEKA